MSSTPASDLIDTLGGTGVVAAWLDQLPQTVSNWRKRGIPHRHRLTIARKLAALGQPDPSDAAFEARAPKAAA